MPLSPQQTHKPICSFSLRERAWKVKIQLECGNFIRASSTLDARHSAARHEVLTVCLPTATALLRSKCSGDKLQVDTGSQKTEKKRKTVEGDGKCRRVILLPVSQRQPTSPTTIIWFYFALTSWKSFKFFTHTHTHTPCPEHTCKRLSLALLLLPFFWLHTDKVFNFAALKLI